MKLVLVSREAQADLRAIYDQTLATWGKTQAAVYASELKHAISNLASFPQTGPDVSHIRKGYRRLLVGSHAVYYRDEADQVTIMAVVHVRQDPQIALERR